MTSRSHHPSQLLHRNPESTRDTGLGRSTSDLTSSQRFIRTASRAGLCAALLAGLPMILVGCKKEEPIVVVEPPPPPPPPPPAAPKVTPIETLMASLNIDPRVRLTEEQAPDNDPARVAVLQFFDSVVRGDASVVGGLLADPDRNELERMQKDGSWSRATEGISRVDLRTGQNPDGVPVVLALFHTTASFQPQLWTYVTTPTAEFAAEPSPPNIVDQLSGDDWIAGWYKILNDELVKAEEPDEKIVIKSVNKDEQGDGSSTEGQGLPPRGKGGGPPGRRPAGEPIAPPSLTPGGG